MKRRGFFASLLALPAVALGTRAVGPAPEPEAHVFELKVFFGDEGKVAKAIGGAIESYRKKNSRNPPRVN